MNDLTKFIIKAYVRKALTILGTYLIARNMMTEGETAEGFASTYLEAVVGAVILVGSFAWTFLYQHYVRLKVKTALQLPKGSTSSELERALERETK